MSRDHGRGRDGDAGGAGRGGGGVGMELRVPFRGSQLSGLRSLRQPASTPQVAADYIQFRICFSTLEEQFIVPHFLTHEYLFAV